MSAEQETTRVVRSWLEEGITALPDRVLDAVLDQVPATPQRRPWWPPRRSTRMNNLARIGVAAAAILVVAVVGYNLLPPATNIGPTQPAPTSAPTSTPASAAPSTSAQSSAMPLPESGPLTPGTYSISTIEPLRITFRVFFPGWVKNVVPNVIWSNNSEARFGFSSGAANLLADPCDPTILRDPPVGPSVEDLASAIASMPGIASTTADIELAGFSGKLVEVIVTAEDELCEGYGVWLAGPGEAVPLDRGRTRFWILDVNGTRLVIDAVERLSVTASGLGGQMHQMLDSITVEAE